MATLGARGDGIAHLDGRPVYLPGTLPGETVIAEIIHTRGDGFAAVATSREAPSRDRVEPACPHFGSCGGCSVQHFAIRAYLEWKRDLVREALRRRGFEDIVIEEVATTPPGRRRRAVFSAMHARRGPILGFHERGSHRLVDIEVCPVLLPALASLIAPLKRVLGEALPAAKAGQVTLNDTDTGIDCQIASDGEPDLAAREALADFAASHDLARVSWRARNRRAEPIAQRRLPVLRLGQAVVAVPPGGFLQASREGEAAIRRAVREGTDGAASLVDLFGGIGTLSLELAPAMRVHVVEGDAEACASVERASRAPSLRGRLSVERRNLDADPVPAVDLAGFAAALFDPPRTGAAAQARELAASSLETIVAVSCDPGTFARDARILADGGYRLEKLVPVDQFLWSAHVELVALFRRNRL